MTTNVSEFPASTAAPTAAASNPRSKRGLFSRIRLFILWLVLMGLIAIQAPVFPHVVRGLLLADAWRKGVNLHIGRVQGSLFEPVILSEAYWHYTPETGGATRVEVRKVRAWFAWSNIFPEPISNWVRAGAAGMGFAPIGQNGRWFQLLELDGLSAKLLLPDGPAEETGSTPRWLRSRLGGGAHHLPVVFSVRDADFVIGRADDYLHAERVRMTLSEIEPGTVLAAQLSWKIQGTEKSFRDVGGRTSLQESTATVAGLRLGPDVRVESFSVGLADLAKGKLTLNAALAAFGGEIKAQGQTAPHGRELSLDVSGNFKGINVGSLTTFLGISDAAGGLIKDGHFSFRGTPRDLAGGQATVRLEATNFQWETRQWDSLVLGLTVLDQRLQIPELRLHQGVNSVTLSGSMALPSGSSRWWERAFDFKVDAEILNLTDLSALLMPDFKYAAGGIYIRGAVSGNGAPNGAAYDGQLILSGAQLKWRTAPLDVLQAAVLFHGRELQIINAQLLHGEDYLRGSGKISLAGDGGYEGNVRLSVRDLAIYQALLAPPVLPAPLAGRALVEWQGKGGSAPQEGQFSAQLEKFRMLGAPGLRATHPLDANFSGSYASEQMQFEEFRLSEDGTTLTATVALGPSAVNLRNLRVMHGLQTWLEGDALLPLDLWQRWPDVDFTRLLNDDTVARVNLVAHQLGVRETALLTGIEWPLAGTLDGTLTAEGPLTALKLGGALKLAAAKIPLDWRAGILTDVNADFTLDAQTATLTKATGRHATGAFTVAGKLDLSKPHTPQIEAAGAGTHNAEPFSFKLTGPTAAPKLTTEGPAPFAPAPEPAAPTVPPSVPTTVEK